MIIYIFFVVSVLLNLTLGYFAFNTVRKLEQYEDYVLELQAGLIYVLRTIKAIDLRGAFETDDEVGSVFKAIHGMIISLEDFTLKETDGQTQKTNITG